VSLDTSATALVESSAGQRSRSRRMHPNRYAKAAPATQPSRAVRSGRRGRDVAIVLAAWFAGALWFFRATWTSGFGKLTGDPGDARLAVYLCEHWFMVLRGRASWLNPSFFYPAHGTLGWTDTFLIYQVFYAPFHLLGADEFLSFELTLISASLVGFASFVALARMLFKAPVALGVGGAFIFTFANNMAVHAGSTQLLGVYFIPAAICVAVAAWRNLGTRPRRSAVLFCVFGLFYALLLFSCYYVTWLSMLAALVLLMATIVVSPRLVVARIFLTVKRGWGPLLAGVCAFGVGIIPFVRVYLPVIHEFGGRPYSYVLQYSPSTKEGLLSFGSNLIWENLQSHVAFAYEASYALTPLVMLAVVVVGPAVLLWNWRSHSSNSADPLPWVFGLALCVTTLVLAVLPINTRYGSLWILAFHLPGAEGIRAADRLEVVTGLVASLALVNVGTVLVRRSAKVPRRTLVLGLVLLATVVLCVEQVDSGPLALIPRSQELSTLQNVTPAPARCTTFFVTGSDPGDSAFYDYQIDAMFISQKVGIPTLNGYSGENPPYWGLEFPESGANYLIWVRRWAARNHVESGVCDLDLSHMTWTPFAVG
jgi:hypothetical protein